MVEAAASDVALLKKQLTAKMGRRAILRNARLKEHEAKITEIRADKHEAKETEDIKPKANAVVAMPRTRGLKRNAGSQPSQPPNGEDTADNFNIADTAEEDDGDQPPDMEMIADPETEEEKKHNEVTQAQREQRDAHLAAIAENADKEKALQDQLKELKNQTNEKQAGLQKVAAAATVTQQTKPKKKPLRAANSEADEPPAVAAYNYLPLD